MICLGGGCGSGSADTPRDAPSQYEQAPQPFANVFVARVAGERDHLWLLVGGRVDTRRRQLTLRLMSMQRDGTWKVLPAIPGSFDEGVPVGLALRDGRPCISASTKRHAVVRCLNQDQRWSDVFSRRSNAARFYVQEVQAVGGDLVALASVSASGGRRGYRMVMLDRRVTWIAGTLRHRGFASLGAAHRGVPTLTTQAFETRGVIRRTYRLSGGRWKAMGGPITGYRAGPQTSGPVVSRGYVAQAINQGSGRRWPFSVAVSHGRGWRPVRPEPLNQTDGRAQGAVYAAQGRPWAIWQEHLERTDGHFDTRIFAVPVDPVTATAERPTELWRGRSVGPGDLGVTEALGAVWTLAMRPPSDKVDALQPLITRIGD